MRRPRFACLGGALACWVCAPLGLLAGNPDYSVQSWQIDDGLPQNSVNAVVQTRMGYLWLGTFNGLVRFDGVRFTIFDKNNSPELKNSRITGLFEDSRARLWIGHETGEVSLYDQDGFHPVEVPNFKSRRAILSLQEDEAGDIWLLNAAGLLVRLEDGLSFPPAPAAAGETMPALARNRDGALWVIRGGNAMAIQQSSLAARISGGEGPHFVKAICASEKQGLWTLLGDGSVQKWLDGKWGADSRTFPAPQRIVTAMAEGPSGTIAVGTAGDGLYLLPPDGAPPRQWNHLNGLSDDWVRSLCQDREGNLWVGTGNGGLDVLRPSKILDLSPPDHWQGRAVLSVCVARDGGLWVGTEGAGLYHFHQGAWEHFGNESGLANLFVWSVLETAEGGLWVGTWGGGLFTRKDGRFEAPVGLEGLGAPVTAVTALYEDRAGQLWAGTREGFLHYSLNQANWVGRQEDLALTDIRAIVQDRQGAIWFGMSGGGLACLSNGALTQFRTGNGLMSDFIQCLHEDEAGALWIGTFGGGLSRRKQNRFATIGAKQGLPNNVICGIEDDGQGHFWMSSHGGIFRVEKEELNRCADGQIPAVHCLAYGKSEGLPTLECSGGCQPVSGKTPDGCFWFPTRKGLVSVNPGSIPTNNQAPPVVIERVLVDMQAVELPATGASLKVPPGRTRLEFDYTGLSFTAPEKVRFKHWLEGFEPQWSEAENQRTANYGYLPPGHYTFHVIACNNDGVWNETGASLGLLLLPHLWQTWWFETASGVFTVAAAGGLALLLARQRLRRKMERLEQQQALERERARIAQDIHDDLGASLTRITMLCQSVQGEPEASEPNGDQIEEIYQTASSLTRAMDEIVWAVNPKHDRLDSLAAYLGKFAHDFLRPVGIRCRLEVPVLLPPVPLTAEVRHNVFLAFEEALNNAVKHSGAREVRISLGPNSAGFVLTVEDNGRGFAEADCALAAKSDPDRASSGNGLANMRHRLDKIQGRCQIFSAPGAGTKVKFTVHVKSR